MTDPDLDLEAGGVFAVELLSPRPFAFDAERYLAELATRESIDGKPGDRMALAFHTDRLVEYRDGTLPAQSMICLADGPFDPASVADALEQTWDWVEAEEVVGRCRHAMLLTDVMAQGLAPADRLDLFAAALVSALACLDVEAIYWPTAGRVARPAPFLEACRENAAFFEGPVNVRLFQVDNGQEGETIMDTRGMSLFHLPDVQCHFVGLDPSAVAQFLYNAARYLFTEGDVIEDGHTLNGLEPGQKWPCRHEESLAPPRRIVLDIDPSPFCPPRT